MLPAHFGFCGVLLFFLLMLTLRPVLQDFVTQLPYGFDRPSLGFVVVGGVGLGQFGGPERARLPQVDGDENVASPAKLIEFFPQ